VARLPPPQRQRRLKGTHIASDTATQRAASYPGRWHRAKTSLEHRSCVSAALARLRGRGCVPTPSQISCPLLVWCRKGFAGFKRAARSPFGSVKAYVSAEAKKNEGQGCWEISQVRICSEGVLSRNFFFFASLLNVLEFPHLCHSLSVEQQRQQSA
jgi:hypothetical protein